MKTISHIAIWLSVCACVVFSIVHPHLVSLRQDRHCALAPSSGVQGDKYAIDVGALVLVTAKFGEARDEAAALEILSDGTAHTISLGTNSYRVYQGTDGALQHLCVLRQEMAGRSRVQDAPGPLTDEKKLVMERYAFLQRRGEFTPDELKVHEEGWQYFEDLKREGLVEEEFKEGEYYLYIRDRKAIIERLGEGSFVSPAQFARDEIDYGADKVNDNIHFVREVGDEHLILMFNRWQAGARVFRRDEQGIEDAAYKEELFTILHILVDETAIKLEALKNRSLLERQSRDFASIVDVVWGYFHDMKNRCVGGAGYARLLKRRMLDITGNLTKFAEQFSSVDRITLRLLRNTAQGMELAQIEAEGAIANGAIDQSYRNWAEAAMSESSASLPTQDIQRQSLFYNAIHGFLRVEHIQDDEEAREEWNRVLFEFYPTFSSLEFSDLELPFIIQSRIALNNIMYRERLKNLAMAAAGLYAIGPQLRELAVSARDFAREGDFPFEPEDSYRLTSLDEAFNLFLAYNNLVKELGGRFPGLVPLETYTYRDFGIDTIDLGSAMRREASLTRDLCKEKKIGELELQFDESSFGEEAERLQETSIDGDTILIIRNGLRELFDNAIKYTYLKMLEDQERGALVGPYKITATADTIEEGGLSKLRVTIEDTGKGMDRERLEWILAGRVSGTDESAQRYGIKSTGLGLAALYRSINSIGGRVEATSSLGRGSTFTLIVPLSEPSEPPSERTSVDSFV